MNRNSTSFQGGRSQQKLDADNEASTFLNLITATIEAIWEQSEQSELNRVAWNRVGAVSKYCCSIYGLSCLVMALVLNRTLVMASTNSIHNQQLAINQRRQRMPNNRLVALYKPAAFLKNAFIVSMRIGVVAILACQLYNILIVLKLNEHLGLAQGSNIPWLYKLIPEKWFETGVLAFESSKYLHTPSKQVMIGPTSDMYWPIFKAFCLSSFIETFISSVQGTKACSESGITIFEHSLAFQEFSSNAAFFFSNSYHYKRPTEEVLLTSMFSILNHINIHVGAIINKNRYRLIPSTVFGLAYLSYFLYSASCGSIFSFPSILVLTITPQILICMIISTSALIFLAAIVVNGFQFRGLNYASFFTSELQSINEVGNVEDTAFDIPSESALSQLNINWNDDFYSALLSVGVLAITSAGKSSYITELSLVTIDAETWVERSLVSQMSKRNISGQGQGQGQGQGEGQKNEGAGAEKVEEIGYQKFLSEPYSTWLNSGPEGADTAAAAAAAAAFSSQKSIFKARWSAFCELANNFYQLIYGLVVEKMVKNTIKRLFSNRRQRARHNRDGLGRRADGNSSGIGQTSSTPVPSFLKKYIRIKPDPSIGELKQSGISLDSMPVQIVEQNYASILSGADLDEWDNSEDYVYYENEYSEAEEEEERESDIEAYLGDTNLKNLRGNHQTSNLIRNDSPALLELFDREGVSEIFSQEFDLQMIRDHYNYKGRLTRSKYGQLYRKRNHGGDNNQDNDETEMSNKHEAFKLFDLIVSKRSKSDSSNEKDGAQHTTRSLECVICQTNMREIITWPCKCFAICEPCRLSLVSKGIEGCVCCRSEVRGVSKVYIP
ncbi:hypothetical protein PVL30_002579 [Lodderomyces elongisporus]|uniref:uncharacterized protein n=1 Tax=Lodderomyces elongisporus TaxID=36914 RepID=UPI0029256532|nr:uncharacterized protein PVL30_002579 [Lodderomyces elongisporus]WLF78835.1 hypothetical protein PVL30_002579 [Lodderomyces elongisporus]